jgi:hypothetical protein
LKKKNKKREKKEKKRKKEKEKERRKEEGKKRKENRCVLTVCAKMIDQFPAYVRYPLS